MRHVNIPQGAIQGVERNGIHQFRGIRYAEAPVGDRRFLPPVRTGAFDGVYDATRFGARAPQGLSNLLPVGGPQVESSEDCLFLNVYTPAPDGAKRPVLVWIHGGAYLSGSANDYDLSVLARQGDVVTVGVSYRLGVLGFFDLSAHGEQYVGSACNGFRDQIAALGWVQDNIEALGGDPDNVTIFGESAGGGSVLALLASPAADGLFHKVMAHSPGGVDVPPDHDVRALLEAVRGADPDSSDPVGELRSASVEDLLAGQMEAIGPLMAASVDGVVVTRHPSVAAAERGIPVLAGSNLDEATLFTPLLPADDDLLRMALARLTDQVARGADPSEYLARLDALHPDDDTTRRLQRVFTHTFRRAALGAVEGAAAGGAGSWLYRFDLPTDLFGGVLGATHAAEIPFTMNWFDPAARGWTMHDRTDENAALARAWSDTLLAFARTGDPNGAGMPEWPRYSPSVRQTLVLDRSVRVEADLPEDEPLRAFG